VAAETAPAETIVPVVPVPAAAAQAQPEPVPVVPSGAGQRPHQRAVHRLKSVPAVDAAAALTQFLRPEGRIVQGTAAGNVVIVPDAVSNSLLIGGPPESVQEAVRLLEQLDRPAAMVVLEVLIAEAPVAEPPKPEAKSAAPGGGLRLLGKPERMEVVSRVRLATLDQQKASVQVSRKEATVTGTSVTPMGQTNQVTYQHVGTKVEITPRVTIDGQVMVQLEVEHSHQASAEEGTPIAVTKDGKTVRAPNMETVTAKTAIHVSDGQTAVLGGHARRPKPDKELLILVTPHVLRMDGTAVQPKPQP
jgi:type II secretory pathway component GspD/PulD (secretin)